MARCWYTCCEDCSDDFCQGTCYCKDSNMGEPYPKKREWYYTGYW